MQNGVLKEQAMKTKQRVDGNTGTLTLIAETDRKVVVSNRNVLLTVWCLSPPSVSLHTPSSVTPPSYCSHYTHAFELTLDERRLLVFLYFFFFFQRRITYGY